MSREEAIEILSEMRAEYNLFGDEEEATRYHVLSWAIQAMKDTRRWIPIKTRPMDEEERAEWSEKLGYDIEYEEAVIYTSQLPDDGQEVLTCSRYGTIRTDKFENDPDYGCSFEENGDMDGIVAWMPLPEPWKGEEG